MILEFPQKRKQAENESFRKKEKVEKSTKKGRITFGIVVELSGQTKPDQTKTEVILHVTFYHRNVPNEKRNSHILRKNIGGLA